MELNNKQLGVNAHQIKEYDRGVNDGQKDLFARLDTDW
jgi:hypothetical protein